MDAKAQSKPGVPNLAPGAAKGAQGFPTVTALDRLNSIRSERNTFLGELRQNWAGWLSSIVLHSVVIGCLGLFVASAPPLQSADEPTIMEPPFSESENPLNRDLAPEEAETGSLVDAGIDEPASVAGGTGPATGNPGYIEGLEPGAPSYLTLGGRLTGLGQLGGVPGDVFKGKAGKGFRRRVEGMRGKGLEVVFCFDSTGSMGGIIQETKTRIRQLMRIVTYLVPKARLGIVTYRDLKQYDLDNYEYTTKIIALTSDVAELEKFLRGTEPMGGGDIPEDIYDGLDKSMNEEHWSQGTVKVIIVFGDAPPHPEDDGLNKVYNLIAKWHKETGGVVSCIDTGTGPNSTAKIMDEFKDMAKAGGGDATLLQDEKGIIQQLVVYIFGADYKEQVEKVFKFVETEKTESVNVIIGGDEGEKPKDK